MNLVLVHPEAALVGAAVLVPLGALWLLERRKARIRALLGLAPPPTRASRLAAGALVVLAALVATASAQPVLLRQDPVFVRADAEAYVVIDITRSMLAGASRSGDTRLERAVRVAAQVRAAVPDVPVGLASFTNRIVPHVFPTDDAVVFRSGLRRSIEVESPPPDRAAGAVLTAFDALAPLQTHNFFAPESRRRVAVIVTDGETNPVSQRTIAALRRRPRLDLVLVRVWGERERIFQPGVAADRSYRTDPGSTEVLRDFVRATGARLYAESDARRASAEVARLLGRGAPVRAGSQVSAQPLAVWTFGLAFVPLGYLLWRRNV
ncbi:MAG: VWA domain-containing protein [Actinobacteria bacterium]|nr:VWA domain-containing protein [Actinomycetota bacterium]